MFARKHIWRCCHQRVASFCDIIKGGLLEFPPRKAFSPLWEALRRVYRDETFILSSSRAASFLPSGSPSSLLCRVVDIIAAEPSAARHSRHRRRSGTRLRAAPYVSGGVGGGGSNQVGHHPDSTRWPQKLQHRELAGASAGCLG